MIQLQLANITLVLGAHRIFENLNWEIQNGQKIGLIGPNGVGKSSLFKLIEGEHSPEMGGSITRARVDPEDVILLRFGEEIGFQQAGHQPLRPVVARGRRTQARIIHQPARAPEVEAPGFLEWVGRVEIGTKLRVRRFLIAPPLEDVHQPIGQWRRVLNLESAQSAIGGERPLDGGALLSAAGPTRAS